MNLTHALTAERTITSESAHLTSARPVHVLTHLFNRAGGAAVSVQPIRRLIRGPAFHIQHNNEFVAHDHEHYEIAVIIGGRAIHQTALYESEIGPGSVLVVAPGQIHGIRAIDGLCVVNCVYMPEWLLHDMHTYWDVDGLMALFLEGGLLARTKNQWIPHITLDGPAFARALQELRDIAEELEQARPEMPYLQWALGKLLVTLGRARAAGPAPQSAASLHPRVEKALYYIEDKICGAAPFSVEAAARGVGISSAYLSRLFKQALGQSPMEYYQRRRIQRAAWLLLNSKRSITEVAHTLGFCDSAHFSKLFKRHQGTNPRDYRERFRDRDAG